jgi:hypothetical protein
LAHFSRLAADRAVTPDRAPPIDSKLSTSLAKPSLGLIELAIGSRGDEHVQFDPSFRIANVTKFDITAVYDLNALVGDEERDEHSLPIGILENCRMTLSDWISTKAGPTS